MYFSHYLGLENTVFSNFLHAAYCYAVSVTPHYVILYSRSAGTAMFRNTWNCCQIIWHISLSHQFKLLVNPFKREDIIIGNHSENGR